MTSLLRVPLRWPGLWVLSSTTTVTLKGKPYAGWIDAKTNEPVDDKDVKTKYESYILDHAGIRLIEPELFNGYDPNKKQFMQEVIIEHDLGAL